MPTTQESQRRELSTKDVPGRNDPDVVIPAAVKAAAARAEAIHKAAYPEPAPAEPHSNGAPLPDEGARGGSPAGAAPGSPTPSSVAPAPTSVPSVAPAQPPAQQLQPPPQPDDWEHRYRSMAGRYDRAQDSIRQMAEQITNLQNVLATVSSQPSEPVPRELRAESLLSQEEVSEYGSEFLDVVGRKAREAASPLVQQLENKIQGLEQQLGQVGGNLAQTARLRMFSELDQALPAWRQINEDRKFFQWLALPDLYSGAIRHNLLRSAWDRNDTARSLAFFRGFLTEEAAVDPAYQALDNPAPRVQPNGSQAPQPLPGQQNGKIPLEQFAAPGRAKSAAELPAEKPFISRAQISKFYADCAANKYRGDEAERVRLEKMIFDAQTEGRIIN